MLNRPSTMLQALVLLVCALTFASCAHDLSGDYPFKATLNTAEEGGLYELYWTFDNEAETISFAVRVQTTGWVGFGISPNGQMPNSDVVIGWVTDDGQTMFRDRFASRRTPPAIDEQQDWELKNGEEENGFTLLEFSRKFVTCDDADLPITTETARVIWSFHSTTDPPSEDLTSDLIHSERGSLSLNLLGGLPNAAPDPEDLQYFDVTVDQVTIPDADTTYWCAASQLPQEIRDQTRYVTKFSPAVTDGNEAHVHHLLVYLCKEVNETLLGGGADCGDGAINDNSQCVDGYLIAAWAVGGEDFIYPENVAYPVGGEGSLGYALLELHYDNPHEIGGTSDSSGLRIWYTSTAREHDAGILSLGYAVNPLMVIPPKAKNFTAKSFVPSQCTGDSFPEDGIHAFANILHTHLTGHGLTLQHLRYNPECGDSGGYEELEPIDRNLQYDSDFQQITHLRRDVVILPGDVIQLQCFYNTESREGVTVGGYGTREEMCISFLVYYPRINITYGLSVISEDDYYQYLGQFPSGQKILARQIDYVDGLNAITWDENERQNLQDIADNSNQVTLCGITTDVGDYTVTVAKFPNITCPYIAPDQCPQEREEETGEDAGVVLRASVSVLLVFSLLAAVIGQ